MLRLLTSSCARGLGSRVATWRPSLGLLSPGSPRIQQASEASDARYHQSSSCESLGQLVGICSMMHLPLQPSPEGLDAAFIGVPLDTGTSNRPGARFGPRRIREESVMLGAVNPSTGALPFQSLRVADLGDVNVNLYNLQDSCRLIREVYQNVIAAGCIPLTLVHVGAHTNTADKTLGEKVYHRTAFRRSVDEGLLDCKRVVQIGIRGSSMTLDPYRYSRSQGFRVVLAEDCWMKSLVPLMAEIRQQMEGKPLYISFCIDALDPAYAPGTGAPEVAGLTPSQALEIIRGCQGLNVVGCDLVEVSPPYDLSGNTALLAANLMFEMLCALPKVTTV
ncbi:Agmatinase, mitochondrial [Cricetulus griseus]|uniref:Agmatinase, mitochondrial n=1 Tax=Cricetulus griseus TaxID=10029 RepID=G3I957_CRIGR|nr:Agmatinase, mitochondrial [Cricetulus griseus]ERE81102.1 agmatinase [Cricetulus griseus]